MSITPLFHQTEESRRVCWYCGCSLVSPPRTNIQRGAVLAEMRTRDHIVPRSSGGQKTVASCARCNHKKDSLMLDEFRRVAPVIFAVYGRPGFAGFYGEKREAELRKENPNTAPAQDACADERFIPQHRSERVNTIMAEKLKAALNL
jgi:HNH endonuclease